MADLSYIIHVSRVKKTKTAGGRWHQKPLRIVTFQKPAPPQEEPVAPKPPTESYFTRANLDEPKSSAANPLKTLGNLLHKDPPPATKQATQDFDANTLSGMTKRVYYGIANAFADQAAREKAHALFVEKLAQDGTDELRLGEKSFKIINVSGPSTVDNQFIEKVLISLEEIPSRESEMSPRQSSLSLKDFLDKLETPPEQEVVEEIPERVTPQDEIVIQTITLPEENLTDNTQLLTAEELIKVVSDVIKNAIKPAAYHELVAPFYRTDITDDELQQLIQDERTQNATFKVYTHGQLNQLLEALGLQDEHKKTLLQSAENEKTKSGITRPEYFLSFCVAATGIQPYRIHIIETVES